MECERHIVPGHDVWRRGPLHPAVPGDPPHRKHRRLFSLCLPCASGGKQPKNIVLVVVSLAVFVSSCMYLLLGILKYTIETDVGMYYTTDGSEIHTIT